jgi:hypothetical protein
MLRVKRERSEMKADVLLAVIKKLTAILATDVQRKMEL